MRHFPFLFSLIAFTACQTETKTTEPLNATPVADAGADFSHASNAPVLLNGSASSDADNDELVYKWSFSRVPAESALIDDDFSVNLSSSPNSSFVPDMPGIYIVSLTVVDAQGEESFPDSTIITVDVDHTPVSDAGENLSATQDVLLDIDGSGSYDPQGLELTYSWRVNSAPEGSTITDVDDPTQAQTSFTPDVSGLYVLTLTVNNGLSDSVPDMLVVTAASSNPQAPVANPGNDISSAEDCSMVELSGSASYDPNGDPLSYWWSLQSKPPASKADDSSISDRTVENPTFFPDVAGEYNLSLAVNDGQEWSSPESLTLMAMERSYNTPPVVNAGTELNADAGDALCTMSGYSYVCASCDSLIMNIGDMASISDADNDALTHEWSVVEGQASIANPTSLETNVTLNGASASTPGNCDTSTYRFALTATDCTGAQTVSELSIAVNCCGVAN